MARQSDSQGATPRVQDGSPAPPASGIKRQFLWSMAPLLVTSAVNIFSVRFFYHYLGAEMYALWFYVTSLSGSFGFMDMGLGTAVGRYIGVAIGAGDKPAEREYWGTGNVMALPILVVMTLVFTGLGIFIGPKWFHVDPEHLRLLQWAFVGGGCNLFLSYYIQFWLLLSQAHFDFKFIGRMRSVLSVTQLLAAVWVAYLTRNPAVVIFAGVLFNVVQLGFFVWHARTRYQLGFNLRDASIARAREMASVSGKVFGTLLVSSFGGSADRLLLGRLAPAAVFANYNVSYNFGARIFGLSFALMGPVFHQTSRALGKGLRHSAAGIYNETFNFTFGWYALLAVWTVFWHPVFLRLWLGRELGEQVSPAFTPLVIAFCLSGVASISTAQLAPLNRVGIELGFSFFNAVGLALCAVAGWYWGGLGGVGWGVLASRIVVVAQDLYVIRMIGAGGWLAASTWRHLFTQIIAGAAFFAVSRLLPAGVYWQAVPAALHGGLIAGWLARPYVKKLLQRNG